jgi:hypothetical protein
MRLLLICAAALPLGACHASWEHGDGPVHASGPSVARTYDAKDFTSVDLRGSDDVVVKIGDTFSIRAEGPEKVLDDLKIVVDGTTLKIGRKEHSGWNWSDDDGAKITVTMPKLVAASIAGSGDLTADSSEGDFKGEVAGSGTLRVSQLKGGNVDLAIAGSGDVIVAGTAAALKTATAGSGDIDAKGLNATSANISIAGSGNVSGTVHGDAKVSLMGSGDVDLGGGAKCSTSSMGSGEAHCS